MRVNRVSLLSHHPLFPTPDSDPSLALMTSADPRNPAMPALGPTASPLSRHMPVVEQIIQCKSCALLPPNPSESHRKLSHTCLRASQKHFQLTRLQRARDMFYLSTPWRALSMTHLSPRPHTWAQPDIV